MQVSGQAWLFYDADCRICSSLARWVTRLDLRNTTAVRPLQEAAGMLSGIPGDEILDAMRAIGRDGLVHEGGDGLLVVAAALLDGSALETILLRSSVMRGAARRTYALLVEFRGHLVCRIPGPEATSAGR